MSCGAVLALHFCLVLIALRRDLVAQGMLSRAASVNVQPIGVPGQPMLNSSSNPAQEVRFYGFCLKSFEM